MVTAYLTYLHLGVIDGISKRIPVLIGQGREKEAERLERAGITVVFLTALAGASVMWAYALLATGTGVKTRYALAIGGVYLIFMQVSTVFRLVLRARQQFRLMARATVIEALVLLALVVAGSALMDAPGTMVGWAIGLGVVCLYLMSHKVLPVMPLLDIRAAVELAKAGMPILGVNLCHRILRTIDKVVIVKVFGAGTLGFYDVAWQLSAYLYNVPGAVGEVVTPKVLKAHGEGNSAAITGAVLQGTKAMGILMPALAGFTALAGPIMLRVILPRYVDAIAPVQILLMAMVLLAVPTALRATLIARNRETEMMVCDLAAAAVAGSLVWWLASRDAPMHELALGAGVGWAIGGLLTTWRGLLALDVPATRIANLLAWAIVPLAYCSAVLFVLKGGVPGISLSDSPMMADLIGVPIFVALTAPLIWIAERQTGIVSRLRRREEPRDPGENPDA